jgi:hypothetical protein
MEQVAMTRIAGLGLALTLLGHGGATGEEPAATAGRGGQAPYTIASALGTVLYTPLKGVLCLTGGIGSGFAFLSSGPTAAKAVASASCKGKWILTPAVLQGTQPFEFVGEIDQTPGR